jgi:hypothetical protein
MEVNEINKELYEAAFIQNGEYGYHENHWKPSIDEREIEEYCCDEDGHEFPATPLGYRDYKISRINGLKNIFDQVPCVDLTDDKYHHIKREDNVIKLYDKIKINEDEYFIVCGDDEDKYYVVSDTNKLYCVSYEKERH